MLLEQNTIQFNVQIKKIKKSYLNLFLTKFWENYCTRTRPRIYCHRAMDSDRKSKKCYSRFITINGNLLCATKNQNK